MCVVCLCDINSHKNSLSIKMSYSSGQNKSSQYGATLQRILVVKSLQLQQKYGDELSRGMAIEATLWRLFETI